MKFEATLGNNCRSVAMSTVLRNYGYTLSEAMCFGIGETLDFLGSETRFGMFRKLNCYAGNNENDIFTLANSLNIELKIIQPENTEVVKTTIENFIFNKIPVIARVSLDKYLNYIPSSLTNNKESTKSIFKLISGSAGNHVVVIVNCGNSGVLIHEPNIIQPVTVPWKDFLQAMNPSNAVVYHPSNTLITLNINRNSIKESEVARMREVIWKAIFNNMNKYLNNQSTWGGVHLIEELVDVFLSKSYDKKFKQDAEFFRFFCDIATGGGFYRRLYGKFLKEANSKYLHNDSINLISKRYYILSRKWSNFSKEISKDSYDYVRACKLIEEISKIERELSTQLFFLSKRSIYE